MTDSTDTAADRPQAISIHPAAEIFPVMTGAEFEALKSDIAIHGQHEPMTYSNDQLIDGRNRLRACQELGIEPSECKLDSDVDPLAYVLSHNLLRRQLAESQRAMVAAKLATFKHGANQHAKNAEGQICPSTIDQAATLLNVSPRTVKSAKQVVELGCEKLQQLVDSGEVSVSKAARIAKAVKSPEEQVRLATERPARNPNPAEPGEGNHPGVGVKLGKAAVKCLKQIPIDDALRDSGFEIVTNWIRKHRGVAK